MEEKGQCMRRKYLIGLFFICLLCIVILIILIQMKRYDERDLQKLQLEEKAIEIQNEELETQNVSQVDATVVENIPKVLSEYYAKNVNGCICIFKADGNTLFYESDILFEDLPIEVREEIDGQGKYFSTELEVYYFLESYSS